MNELSQFLVDSILLGEADSVDNKVVVYAGRFQPFHKGHYATYSHLVKKFGKNNVYIGTSNKTDNNKSPFNFKEKVMIITKMFGIPSSRIIEVKNPYVPTEVLKKFDKDTTAFITVVGKKDASRLGGKFFTPYKDNLDFEGYEDKGYVYIAPNQSNPISGTDVRNGLKSGSEDDKKNFFSKRAYPKFDKKIFGFITNTLNEERIITKEMVESWLIQNVDLIKEATSTMGKTAVDDGPNYIFPSYAVFDRVSKKRAEAIGYTVLSQIMSDELTDIDPHPIYPNGPVKAVTPFPAGVAGKTTATNQKDYYGSEAYSKWWSHVTRLAGLVGYSLIDYIDLDDDREESLRDLGAEREEVGNTVSENITIPINVGDTVLGGKFKNKRIVVKTIGKNEKGDITINGKSILRIRVIEEGTLVELSGTEVKCEKCNHQWEIESDDSDKYLCHSCGWDSQKQKLDIIGLYKWKESNSMMEGLLIEGGAYGHMNHPFDTEINLTFGQLKDIVNKALEGNLDLAREKTDGQALAVSWRDGRLVAARNKGHLKNKGENALDIKGVATKFAGRGELEKAYNFAMNDLSKAIKSLSEKQRDKIFKGGACFMNLEVIYPTSVNVIPYGQALLVFHGTMEFNEEGIAIGENQDAAKILAGMIKQVNQDVQSAYTISGPPINELPKSKNLTSLKGKYNSKISKLQSKFKLKDNDGIADYHQAFWMDFVNKKSPSKLDNRTLMGLVKRWAFYDKSFRLDKKNLSDVKTMEWAKGIDKNDHAKMAKDNIRPFEDIFLGIGADILSFMSSVLTANPDKAIRAMKNQLDKTIKDVRKSGDVKKIAKLKMELQRLKAIGGTDKIVPNEGIVFVYGGKTFKLTGTFAPLNQILGLFYE
jgi:hypothetical protein